MDITHEKTQIGESTTKLPHYHAKPPAITIIRKTIPSSITVDSKQLKPKEHPRTEYDFTSGIGRVMPKIIASRGPGFILSRSLT